MTLEIPSIVPITHFDSASAREFLAPCPEVRATQCLQAPGPARPERPALDLISLPLISD